MKLQEKIDSGYPQLEECFKRINQDQFHLFCKKQKDYGPNNISKFGEHGVIVRVSDKVERLINLTKNSAFGTSVLDVTANESIDDTWTDIAIYAKIALLVRHGEWPK